MSVSAQQRFHSFGDLVRRRRRALELTQAQLGERVACSEDMVRKIESDLRRPSRWLADRLLKHLEIAEAEHAAFLKAARLGSGLPPASAPKAPAPACRPPDVAMVGRSAEMAQIVERMAQTRLGRGALVLVEGEPGIGKSHLAQAARSEATSSGFLTCAAPCYEIDRAIPLQPVVDWINRMLDALGPEIIDELSAATQAELAELSPRVRELRPRLQPAAGPELRRSRIFNAFAEFMLAFTRRAPMLIVIDDIHWADAVTLPLLHHLVRQARSEPLMLVLTFRSEELAGNEALALFVQSAVTDLGALRLALPRLVPADVQHLLTAQGLAGHEQLGRRLYQSSEGHPLYLASMLQQLRDSGGLAASDGAAAPTLPPALRDSIRERLRRLPAPARELLDIAAVLGRRFDFFALERGAGLAGSALADAVDLLVQRLLLREIDDGASFDFAHDKIREVVYDDLGSARRIVLHRRAAEALAAASEGCDAAAIAGHYELAHQWDAAVLHHERAARRSLGLSGLHEATRAVERAMRIVQAHPGAADAAMRVRLLENNGDAHAQDGRSAEAVEALEAAVVGARKLGDEAWTRDLLTKLGMAHRRADDYERARQALSESLAASRAIDEPQRVADTLYHLGTVAWSNGDNDVALACHGEAVQLCEAHGYDGLVAVQAFHGEGEGRFSHAEPQRAIECFKRSLRLARELGDRGYEGENLTMIAWCFTGSRGLGDYAQAEDWAKQALAVVEAAGQVWQFAPARAALADAWRCLGRSEEALRLLEAEHARTAATGQVRFNILVTEVLARLLDELGRHDEAAARWQAAMEAGAERGVKFWDAYAHAGLALARLHGGHRVDVAALATQAEAALARSDRCAHARCLEALAEGALRAGEAALARHEAGRLIALAETSQMRELQALGHWLLGRAWIDEDAERATADVAAALATATSLGRPWLAAQAADTLAVLLQRCGQRRAAAAQRAAAQGWRERYLIADAGALQALA